ncbi:MAG: flavodoxin [Clostridia bacterium]|nr:flavodoxin [Clostridia bacterium]MBO7288773.1 flavodoxin [Clostridia bacterium]
MKAVVIYKSKYGSTKKYGQWIANELGCDLFDAKDIKIENLKDYDTVIYGGGLYAEVIAGVSLLTKSINMLEGKKLIVYTTGITPIDCREYYDEMVIQKNFKGDLKDKIKVFNFPGKMLLKELSLVHRTALKTLKKIMAGKENPTDMEKMLIDLCDANGDFSDKALIYELTEYAKE